MVRGWSLEFELRWISGDHKGLASECAIYSGDHEFRDAFGECPASEFHAYCQLNVADRTLQTIASSYMRSLIDTLFFLRREERAHGQKPTIAETIKYLHELTAETGVHAFPALVCGNDQAHVELLRVCADELGISDTLSSLNGDERARVEQLFIDACLLDAQIHHTEPITSHHVPGFPLDRVRCCVPMLHSGRGVWLCSICCAAVGIVTYQRVLFCSLAVASAVCDLAIACPNAESSSASVTRDLLVAAGGGLKSLNKNAYGYHFRNIFCQDDSFVGSIAQLKQVKPFFGRLLCLPYSHPLSPVQRCCLAFVAAACNALCDLLVASLSEEQRATIPSGSLLLNPSLYKHTPAHLLYQVRCFLAALLFHSAQRVVSCAVDTVQGPAI